MKRSEINAVIQEGLNFIEGIDDYKPKVNLPPWAYYTPKKWAEILSNPEEKQRHAEIIIKNLGWDVTDFGSGNFENLGLLLFTLENGNINSDRQYAEKIMIVGEGQVTPWHYHWNKTESIINRAGDRLVVELYMKSFKERTQVGNTEYKDGIFDEEASFDIMVDGGLVQRVKAGGKVVLNPGQRILLTPNLYHKFYGDKGTVLVGEVSMVNDDAKDNRFFKQLPRYTSIVEDEKPFKLLCNEYEKVIELLK
jgi:D-lyxose ketol-isomerase